MPRGTQLSTTERMTVMRLLVEGKKDKDIAKEVDRSPTALHNVRIDPEGKKRTPRTGKKQKLVTVMHVTSFVWL